MDMEKSNSETKNEIDCFLIKKLKTEKNLAVLDKLKSSDHRIVRCKVMLGLKREREKLFRMKRPNISTVKGKSDEFAVRIQGQDSTN